MFRTNEGSIDRIARFLIGGALLGAAFLMFTGLWQIVAGVAGAILLVTAAIGFCPLYMLLGINTCPVNQSARR